ncbi:uppS protein [Lactobacillus selangorensis]|uniref:Isoprenyl transferase n=1 Tax=Lactobacillus selangorensis TaxID=81857 RepID=A0A0R2FPM0_9LACO|nr:isoprenyl transferase [Lactobacillus selangorensis]KRN29611.1 uppS protein [Lactobacillus selangorensis]KRN33859.1 uppS protein [Lactobacillus selangorensis]
MFSGKNKQPETAEIQLDPDRIPEHVAIIMDGNGRWAKKRHLPRVAGHKQGMETVKTIAKAASRMGVKVLTLYAFSTENWKRPQDEVKYIMKLPVTFFNTFMPELIEENVRVKVMGYLDDLPAQTLKAAQDAMKDTEQNTGMILNFALNYGSRAEIVTAAQKLAQQAVDGNIQPDEIDDHLFADNLMTAFLGDLADPDLLIRTSGEERISNFLLWQIAYSEMVFVDDLWPDFSTETLRKAIATYQNRDRRFGGIK